MPAGLSTPIWRVPRWRIGECSADMQGRWGIKDHPRTKLITKIHTASALEQAAVRSASVHLVGAVVTIFLILTIKSYSSWSFSGRTTTKLLFNLKTKHDENTRNESTTPGTSRKTSFTWSSDSGGPGSS